MGSSSHNRPKLRLTVSIACGTAKGRAIGEPARSCFQPNQSLTPLLYGSADNLVTAYYDQDGRRAIFDGGFTRLYNNWDTAGTARYVKNAAAWLANAERFPVKTASK